MEIYTGISALDDILNRLEMARSRDEHDAIMCELAAIAPNHIAEFSLLFDADTYQRMPLIWSLIGQCGEDAVELFAKAITDKDQYTRWAAAVALSKCNSGIASTLLVAALKDRSHLVKGTAVDAMSMLGDARAIPQLRKIIASKSLQSRALGIVKSAQDALAKCEKRRSAENLTAANEKLPFKR